MSLVRTSEEYLRLLFHNNFTYFCRIVQIKINRVRVWISGWFAARNTIQELPVEVDFKVSVVS